MEKIKFAKISYDSKEDYEKDYDKRRLSFKG